MAAGAWRGLCSPQLRAVLRKNALETLRNKRDAVREVALPLVLLVALVLIVNFAGGRQVPGGSFVTYPVASLASVCDSVRTCARADACPPCDVWMSPCTTNGTDIVSSIARRFTSTTGVSVRCFPCASGCAGSSMSVYVWPLTYTLGIIAVNATPSRIAYTLHLDAARLAPGLGSSVSTAAFDSYGRPAAPDGTAAKATLPVALPLQAAVEAVVVEEVAARAGSAAPPRLALSTRQFPTPAYRDSLVDAALAAVIPIYMTIIFTLQVRVYLTRILEEKELKLKLLQKAMGVSDETWWSAWLITAVTKNLPVLTLVPLIACLAGIFPHTDFTLVWVMFLLFELTCISFAIGLSCFFDDAKVGAVVGMIAYLSLALPSYAFTGASTPPAAKIVLSLLAPFAFNLGIAVLTRSEQAQRGVTWRTSMDADISSVGVAIGPLMGMLALDAVLYALLAWYLDKVVPSALGSSRHPLFCLGFRRKIVSMPLDEGVETVSPLLEDVGEDAAVAPSIQLTGLTKAFGKAQRVAVNSLNLSLYESQVCCLLGHNGAGKSTTIGMLTGLLQPTAGDATVFGWSLVNDTAQVHNLMGVCMQEDVLFDHLTVLEHMEIYGGIKGLDGSAARKQAQQLIEHLDLTEKQHAHSRHLSGGQRRRLCLAIAFMGDPKVLYLDEPTSGLDPAARRQVWSLIQQRKRGRVIVLTTHFMDEAEILADRIALLTNGRLHACGSPFFFKHAFGLGYHLTLTCPLERQEELAALIKAHAASATSTDSGKLVDQQVTLHVALPRAETAQFPALFDALANAAAAGSVSAYSVRAAMLEEVFLNLDPERIAAAQSSSQAGAFSAKDGTELPWTNISLGAAAVRQVPVSKRVVRQVLVQLWRRRVQFTRDLRSLWLQICTPMLFVAAGIVLTLLRNIGGAAPASPVAFDATQFRGALPQGGPSRFSVPVIVAPSVTWPMDPALPAGLASFMTNTSSTLTSAVQQMAASDSVIDTQLLGATYTAAAFQIATSTPAATISYNTTLTSVIPIMANMLSNALLSLTWNSSTSPRPVISAAFEPLPLTAGGKETPQGNYIALGLLGFMIFAGFNTIPAVIAASAVEEREIKSKQLQIIMGLSPELYWAATWMWDSLQYLAPAFGAVVIIVFGTGHDFRHNNLWALIFLFAAFGIVVPGPAYAASFWFRRPAVAQTYVRLGFSALTIALYFGSFGLEYPTVRSTLPGVDAGASAVRHIFMLWPPYTLAKGFFDVAYLSECSEAMEDAGYTIACKTQHPFSWDIVGGKLLYLILSAPLWYALVLALERRSFGSAKKVDRTNHTSTGMAVPSTSTGNDVHEAALESGEDVDVAEERRAAQTAKLQRADGVVVTDLRIAFGRGKRRCQAVDGLSMTAGPGQCFGLLGPNGAGKSSTIAALVGEHAPSAGDIRLYGHDVRHARRAVANLLGYCPQPDALFPYLTGDEVLTYYAALGGVPPESLQALTRTALAELGMDAHAGKQTRHYSGGMKRRLSLLLAYITSPLVVVLDEPSTGVDPAARRHMFDLIRRAQPDRTSIITTHVMEDADALSTRIGILVHGRFVCLGSAEHLKRRFGRGYTVEIRAADASIVAGASTHTHQHTISHILADAADLLMCLEHTSTFIRLQAEGVRLGRLFDVLETLRRAGHVSDFSVSQTTLEQVFLRMCTPHESHVARRGSSVHEHTHAHGDVEQAPPRTAETAGSGDSGVKETASVHVSEQPAAVAEVRDRTATAPGVDALAGASAPNAH